MSSFALTTASTSRGFALSIAAHLGLLGVLVAGGALTVHPKSVSRAIEVEVAAPGPRSREAARPPAQPLAAPKRRAIAKEIKTTAAPVAAVATSAPVAATAQGDAGSVSGSADGGKARLSFEEELRASLDRAKEYPRLAKARAQTGRVKVAFKVLKSGEFEGIHVVEPSRFDLLNEAAIETVKRVSRFKPVPDEVSRGDWAVTVPIDFRLGS